MRRSIFVSFWAVSWTVAAFAEAICRLGHRALQTIEAGLGIEEWCVLIVVTCGLAYVEGYRALHLRFAPLVVSRALEAGSSSRTRAAVLVAPLYALSLVGAPRGALVRAWLSVAAIACAVIIVRALPAPWRGIVDAAVAAALSWGLAAIVARFWKEVRARHAGTATEPVYTGQFRGTRSG